MGLFDDLKHKARDLAREHGDSIDHGIEKAGDMINQKTGSKHAEQVEKMQGQARKAADKLAGRDDSGR